jgi:LmbE family N-acetylglucosaminyl deacetylase
MNKKILVVAAHPDDEILGCGGTLARHVSQGDQVKTIILAEGLRGRDNIEKKSSIKDLSDLKENALKANSIIGIEDVIFFDFPDNQLDSVPLLEIVKKIESVLTKFPADIIYTHHYSDLNVDHSIVHRSVLTAARPVPGQFVKKIFCFETVSATHWGHEVFRPNYFVNISAFIEKKLSALREYKTEMRESPHVRSIESLESLAKFRGNLVGLPAAEAFEIMRMIEE